MNCLAYGHTQLQWTVGTILQYKSAIIDLYENGQLLYDNAIFNEFFKTLNDRTIRSFNQPTYDITTIIRTIHAWGDNNSMSPISLTRKLCFLLAITGFLRPSDIQCIDDKQTVISPISGLKLIIIAPKEKRGEQHIEKTVPIKPHEDVNLGRVKTECFATHPVRFHHPRFPTYDMHGLIRSTQDHKVLVGADRISNHIQFLLKAMPRSPGTRVPKLAQSVPPMLFDGALLSRTS